MFFMSEKLAEVFDQYDMEIVSSKKGRGATILATKQGARILEPFRGNVLRLEQEFVLKKMFEEYDFLDIDMIIPNKDGGLFTCDRYRQPFVLKKYFDGNECDMHNEGDIIKGVKILAKFHMVGKKIAPLFVTRWGQYCKDKEQARLQGIKNALDNGEELEKIAYMYELSEAALREIVEKLESINVQVDSMTDENVAGAEMVSCNYVDPVSDILRRHNAELKKIQKYMSRVKQKKSFENLFLQVFKEYYEQGVHCVNILRDTLSGGSEQDVYQAHYGICHGSYNQHNIIIGNDYEAIVHFERFSRGNQLNDLYQFCRKVMEKNHYNSDLLEKMLTAYQEEIPLQVGDFQYIYIMFLYPEKFWKIANGYYNAKKAFLSPKYVEKLETVILQEEEKRKMLNEFSAFHFS